MYQISTYGFLVAAAGAEKSRRAVQWLLNALAQKCQIAFSLTAY